MRILLTGTRAPVALDLARAFRACGHDVHGADTWPVAVMAGELDSFTACPSPRFRPDAFVRDAEALMARLKPDLVVPLCEEVFYWAQISGPHGWPLFAPDLTTLMRLHSKFAFIELAQSLGLSVPKTQRLQKDSEIRGANQSVFKPEFSRFGSRVLIGPKALELSHDPANPWLQQTLIPGEDVCFHAIARKGQIRAFSAYRSAWRTSGGASYYFDPVDENLNQQLMIIAATLAQSLDLTGQIACDLRLDVEGRPWLIECNPRATSGLHLLAHDPERLTAAFLTDAADLHLTDGRPACIGPAMRLSGWPRAVRDGRLGPWRRDMARARDVFSGTGHRAYTGAASLIVRAALAGRSLSDFLTADFECNRDLTC